MKLTSIFIFSPLIITLIPNVYAQEEFDEEYVDFIMNHINTINELHANLMNIFSVHFAWLFHSYLTKYTRYL